MKRKKLGRADVTARSLVVMTERDVVAILRQLVAKARRGDVAAASVLFSGGTWDVLADFAAYLRAGGK
jgi:hypothetical protein